MRLFILLIVLSGCSPVKEHSILPNYSDMGAAADAGQFVAPEVPAGL